MPFCHISPRRRSRFTPRLIYAAFDIPVGARLCREMRIISLIISNCLVTSAGLDFWHKKYQSCIYNLIQHLLAFLSLLPLCLFKASIVLQLKDFLTLKKTGEKIVCNVLGFCSIIRATVSLSQTQSPIYFQPNRDHDCQGQPQKSFTTPKCFKFLKTKTKY